jgi:hypothetical protein
MRAKVISVGLTALLAASLAVAAPANAAKKKVKPATVGTDAASDWGSNVDPQLAPLGEQLGQDLTKATIVRDKKNINFIIEVTALPPSGGVPEFSRYNWDFTVNGNAMQMSGAFTEYLRGTCNPTYNPTICPPPRDPGTAPFFIRQGGCLLGPPPGPCEEVAKVNGTFDATAGTITIPVPMKAIKAKPGSKIGPGVSSYGPAIYSTPAAFVSNASLPHDTMVVGKFYKVPR